MKPRRAFEGNDLAALHAGKILGIRAGSGPHRFIGLWVVVVQHRVFVRSWSRTAGGWYRTLLEEIRADGCHVLRQRVSLTPVRKLWIAWKTWLKG